eukprot:5104266-Lingulodinium_polyedra.AAC.1
MCRGVEFRRLKARPRAECRACLSSPPAGVPPGMLGGVAPLPSLPVCCLPPAPSGFPALARACLPSSLLFALRLSPY